MTIRRAHKTIEILANRELGDNRTTGNELRCNRIVRSICNTTNSCYAYIIVRRRNESLQENRIIISNYIIPDGISSFLIQYAPSRFITLCLPCEGNRGRSSKAIDSRYVLRLDAGRDKRNLDIINAA